MDDAQGFGKQANFEAVIRRVDAMEANPVNHVKRSGSRVNIPLQELSPRARQVEHQPLVSHAGKSPRAA